MVIRSDCQHKRPHGCGGRMSADRWSAAAKIAAQRWCQGSKPTTKAAPATIRELHHRLQVCPVCVYSSICQQEMHHFHTNRPRICCHLVNSWATHTHTHSLSLSLSLYIYIYDTRAPNTHKTHRHILTFYYMTLITIGEITIAILYEHFLNKRFDFPLNLNPTLCTGL